MSILSLQSISSRKASCVSPEMYLARRSGKCEKYVLKVNIDRIGWKCRINSRAVYRRQVSKNRNNPVVYLLTSLTEGRASILHRLLNYYMRFMASVESMGRRVRPHRYARRRLDFQLAAYRLLVFDICFPFVKLIETSQTLRQYVRYFSKNGNQWYLFSHARERQRLPENVRGIH